jgi:peroxiredoxin Q/BCP
LRQLAPELARRSVVVLVAGPEPAARFDRFFRRAGLPFIGLPDPSHALLRLYGQEVNLFKLGRMPAQVVIDCDGIVRWAHYGHSMADIPGSDELLAALDGVASMSRPA